MHAARWAYRLAPEALHRAVRGLRRSAAAGTTAAVILGLGIGLNVAVYSVVDAALVRPLPYHDPARLVFVWRTPRNSSSLEGASFDTYRDLIDWTAQSHTFDGFAAETWAQGPQVYRPSHGEPRWVQVAPVTANFFDFLGAHPAIGRAFRADDLSRSCVAVSSNRFWASNLGSDSAVVGRAIEIGDHPCTIVGVMPRGFEFYPRETEVWTLLSAQTDTAVQRHPADFVVAVIGRLSASATLETAQRELRGIQGRRAAASDFDRDFLPTVFDLRSQFTWLAGRNLRTTLLVLFAAVAMVLVVTCINVAGLLLSRADQRDREFAIRVALGATRRQLLTQLGAEGVGLAASTLGIAALTAAVALRLVATTRLIELPVGTKPLLDASALAFALVLGVLVTGVAAMAPAVRAWSADAAGALKVSGRGVVRRGGGLSSALVLGEVAFSVVLLSTATMLSRSLDRVHNATLGYVPAGLLTMRVALTSGDSTRASELRRSVVREVSLMPTVTDAALASSLPLDGPGEQHRVVTTDGASTSQGFPAATRQLITPGYFSVMRIPFLGGRQFRASDDAATEHVAIVNSSFARAFLRGDAIGRRIRLDDGDWRTIVGVVGDERRSVVSQEMGWRASPIVYEPVAQAQPPSSLILIARLRQGHGAATKVRDAVRRAAPEAVISDVSSMTESLDRILQPPRARAELLGAFAALGIVIALVGLYALLAHTVAARRREIGVRLALGAGTISVVAPIIGAALRLVTRGVLMGFAATIPVGYALRALLFGIGVIDPLTLLITATVFLLIASVAAALPAFYAARIDPAITLASD